MIVHVASCTKKEIFQLFCMCYALNVFSVLTCYIATNIAWFEAQMLDAYCFVDQLFKIFVLLIWK